MLAIEPAIVFRIFGVPVPDFVVVTWVVMALLVLFAYMATRRLQAVHRGAQNVAEMMMSYFESMVVDMMGKSGVAYIPLIATIGIFTLSLNMSGLIPFVTSPTTRLDTTLSLAVFVFFVAHGTSVYRKGVRAYLKAYLEPYPFMLPMNLIGEVGKVLSHGFRLYGNMFGGLVMTFVFYQLVPWVAPGILNIWFGVFVGVVQSMVFTLLAVAYIQVQAE